MNEIKDERGYLIMKKQLEQLPAQIVFSWVTGIILIISGMGIYFWVVSVGATTPILWVIGIVSIIIFTSASIQTYLKNRYEVEIELWERQQNK